MTSELGQPGQIIDGKYRIVRLLGTGGMGAVFEGENIRIRRRVAIKMLHGSVSTQDDVIKRFEREAQAAALVGSDHICEVLDLGMLPDQTRYMVMEYLEGDTLSGLIKRMGRLKPQQSLPILIQILDALGAAHQAGIIHRDLKPDNVFILPQKGGVQNFVKILDFGVSKFSQMGGESMNVTRAGAVVGTPYYMSPEQARGSSAIDQRTDIYAIGVLLYQATTGQVPYQAETFNELLFKIVLEVAPPPQTYVPDLDAEFSALIQRAMAREPDQRFQSCQQFKDALLHWQNTRSNPLPAYSLPKFGHDDPAPVRTEVMDLSSIPGGAAALGIRPAAGAPATSGQSGASWPAANSAASWPAANSAANWPAAGAPQPQAGLFGQPVGDGTMPMQPGLALGGSGTGAASAMQSSPNWGVGSNPGAIPVGPSGPSATANSWGNASSPSNAIVKPKSGNGLLFGVIGVAALAGVGVAVAVFMVTKPARHDGEPGRGSPNPSALSPSPSALVAEPSGTPAETPVPAPTATPTAAPTATTAAIAPADTATATPTAVTATSSPTATSGAAGLPLGGGHTPGPMPTAKPTAAPKGGPMSTAKPGGAKPGGKAASGDLGY